MRYHPRFWAFSIHLLCWWLTLRRWVRVYAGCVLATHETTCLDFRDRDLVREIYYPEMAGVVRRLTGAEHVVVTSHALRDGDVPGF